MTALVPTLALVLAIGGCTSARPGPTDDAPESVPTESVPTGTVRIGLGEAVAVDGVAVRFARVVEDSRCPPDAMCVWAGRAHVELVVAGETRVLSVPGYGPDDVPSETMTSGLTIRVTALAGPAPSERPAGEVASVWVEINAERATGR